MMNTSEKSTYPFFESIRIEDGMIQNGLFHLNRMMFTCLKNFKSFNHHDIFSKIVIPDDYKSTLCKLKILYNETDFSFSLSPYERKEIRFLQMVINDSIIYEFKSTQRLEFDLLLKEKGEANDVLIIKNGFVSDSGVANIVFFHDNVMLTPADCLLAGTERQRLIKEGILDAVKIKMEDIPYMDGFSIINAMNPLGSQPINPIKQILPVKL